MCSTRKTAACLAVQPKPEGGTKKGGAKEKEKKGKREKQEKEKETKKEKEKKKKKKVVSSSSEEEEEEGDEEESGSDSSDEGEHKKTGKSLSLDTRSPYKAPEIDLLSMFRDALDSTDNTNISTNTNNNVYTNNKSSNGINNNTFYNGNTSSAASQYQQRAATSMPAPNGSPPPRSTPGAPGMSLWPKGSPTPPPLEPMTPLPSSATAHTDGGAVPERATAVVAAALNLVSLQYDLKGEALRECLALALQRLSTQDAPAPDPLDSPAARDSSSPSKPANTIWPANENSQKQKQKKPVTPTTSALIGLWGEAPLAPPAEAKTEGGAEDFFGGLGLWDGNAIAYTTTTTSSSATPVKKNSNVDAAAPSALNFDVDLGPSELAEEPNPFLIGYSSSSVFCLLSAVYRLLSAVCCLVSSVCWLLSVVRQAAEPFPNVSLHTSALCTVARRRCIMMLSSARHTFFATVTLL
jgi:hypothetical protein